MDKDKLIEVAEEKAKAIKDEFDEAKERISKDVEEFVEDRKEDLEKAKDTADSFLSKYGKWIILGGLGAIVLAAVVYFINI